MFKRTHHQAIEQVLRLINADLLKTQFAAPALYVISELIEIG